MTYEEIYKLVPALSVVEKRVSERREVKSYVLRGQRLKERQIEALKNHFNDYAIVYQDKMLNFKEIFGNDNPVVIEIGFGMGDTTARIAASNPDINYIGIEVFLYGFSKLLADIDNKGLKNLKIMRFDAVQVIQNIIPDNSISGFHIFFPDPWPKKRHHNRRIIQEPFVRLLSQKLAKDGYIYCVTDWEDYAYWMLDEMNKVDTIQNPYSGFAPPREWRPETHFERKGLDKDYTIHEIWVIKKEPEN